MLSFTALTTFWLALSMALAQQEVFFANPTLSAQPRIYDVADQQELIYAPTSNNPATSSSIEPQWTQRLSQEETIASIFNVSPTSFSNAGSSIDNSRPNAPIFASSGSTPGGSPSIATTSLEHRQSSQAAFAPQPIVQSGIPTNFASNVTTDRSPQSAVDQSGPPVIASTLLRTTTPPLSLFNPSVQEENLRRLSMGAEKFSLEFLAQISNEHLRAPHRSYMVSPLSVWSLLMLLTEGAQDHTLYELRHVLNLENNSQQAIRAAYRDITKRLNAQTSAVEVASYQALFTDINKPVNRDYENIIEREYETVLTPVNFADVNTTYMKINEDISKATRGLLPYSVLPQDLIDVELLMTSSLYFKGKWRYPFDVFNTHLVPFYDELGNVTGNVEMMTQIGDFTYIQEKNLDSHILELPYGVSNRMSMLIIFPKKGVTLNSVIKSLPKVGISSILQQLDEQERIAISNDEPQEVEVFLPKFTTQSYFSTRYILETMGLIDIFQPAYANLTNISKDVYVSSIFQSTRIIVNEEGTEAAAAAIASLINKSSPVRFFINRPFAYMIVERTANLLLFAGEIKSHM